MVDVHPATGSMTVTQSRTSWGIELGRHRFSVTRTREARTVGSLHGGTIHAGARSRTAIRPAWPLAVGAFASVSAFGLFVVGAIASEPSIAYHPSRYSLSLPVPVRAAKIVKAVPTRGVDKPRQAAIGAVPDLSGPRFDAADESYVIRAMQAGEFQEWTGADGQRRFLNPGPEQAEGDRRCRDLALLVRYLDGSSRTRTARRCAPARPLERTIAAAEAVSVYHPPLAVDTTDLSSSSIDPQPAIDPAYADAGDAIQAAASGR